MEDEMSSERDEFPAPVYVPGHYRIDDGLEPSTANDFVALVTLTVVIFGVFVLCAVL